MGGLAKFWKSRSNSGRQGSYDPITYSLCPPTSQSICNKKLINCQIFSYMPRSFRDKEMFLRTNELPQMDYFKSLCKRVDLKRGVGVSYLSIVCTRISCSWCDKYLLIMEDSVGIHVKLLPTWWGVDFLRRNWIFCTK